MSELHGGTVLSRLVEFLFVCSSNFMGAEWLGLCYNIILYEEVVNRTGLAIFSELRGGMGPYTQPP